MFPKPKKRTKLRLILGTIYYRFLRYIKWIIILNKFTHQKTNPSQLQHIIFRHQTPLFRKLANLDMWLQHNKVTNLRLAISKLDGTVLKPGEVFSFWRLVGKPTRRKGYTDGMVLHNGGFKPGVGGGLCQLSNLIYWMTLHTPLTVVERWRHSYDVFPDAERTQPFGSGATVAYNHIDLQIRNDIEQDFVLHIYLNEKYLVGEWRSDKPVEQTYRIYKKEHKITHEPWGSYWIVL